MGWAPHGISSACVSPRRCPGRAGEMHPFGREEAASQERLLVFFCECVRRGGWGLAQACLPQLCRCPAGGPEKVEAILRALVACPAAVR